MSAGEATIRLIRAYAHLVTVVGDALARLAGGAPFRTSLVRRAMQAVFEETLEREWLLTALARLPRGPDAVAQRLAAVAALTLVMTRRLVLAPNDTVELCMAALFHDLSRLPGEPQPPSAVGARSVVRCSADVLTDEVCHQAAVAAEWSGPLSAAGPSARFVAVPSVFDLLTQPGPARPAVAPNDVMRLLNQLAGERLDASVVELFVRTFGFFPPGTMVRLTDGSTALVVQPPPPEAPLDQPTVRPLTETGALAALERALGPQSIQDALPATLNPLRPWLEPVGAPAIRPSAVLRSGG